MKRNLLFVLLLAVSAILTACGSDTEKTASDKPEEKPAAAEQKKVSNDAEPTEDENGNVIFDKAGQKGKIDTGTLELLKIKSVNETVDIAPLTVTMKDIKIFKLTDMTEEFKEEMSYYNDNQNIGDELNYVQVLYTVENKEDKNIDWNGLTDIVTDKGQQIDAISNDFIFTDSDGDSEFLGKVTKEFADGFVLKDGDVSKLKFIFGASMDSDTYEDITPEQQVEYSL